MGLADLGAVASADDLLPCIIFTILRANPPKFYSDMQFIQIFRAADKMFAESGYYYISTMTAMLFIEKIKAENLTIDHDLYNKYISDPLLEDFPMPHYVQGTRADVRLSPIPASSPVAVPPPSRSLVLSACPKCNGAGGWGRFGACEANSVHAVGPCPTCKGASVSGGEGFYAFDEDGWGSVCSACKGLGSFDGFGPCDIYDTFKQRMCGTCNGRCYTHQRDTAKVHEAKEPDMLVLSVPHKTEIPSEPPAPPHTSTPTKSTPSPTLPPPPSLPSTDPPPSPSLRSTTDPTHPSVVEDGIKPPSGTSPAPARDSASASASAPSDAQPPTHPFPNEQKEDTAPSIAPPSAAPFETNKVASSILLAGLALAVTQHNYDSRARAALRSIAAKLGVSYKEFAQIESELAQALMNQIQAEATMNTKDQKGDTPKSSASSLRVVKVAVAAVAGGAILALTGGLAAPLIAGALGMGGVLSAIGASIGTVGVVVKVIFGATGATVAASKMARKTAGLETFKFEKVPRIFPSPTSSGEEPPLSLHIVIGVSGWATSTNDSDEKDFWAKALSGIQGDHYALLWEPKYLQQLGKEMRSFGPSYIPAATAAESASRLSQHHPLPSPSLSPSPSPSSSSSSSSSGTEMSAMHPAREGKPASVGARAASAMLYQMMLSSTVLQAASVIDHPWGMVKDRAEKAGKLLAHELVGGLLGARPATLVGTSMGARMIFYCLEELSTMKTHLVQEAKKKEAAAAKEKDKGKPNISAPEQSKDESGRMSRDPCSVVEDVFFIGAAIPANDDERWHKVRHVVAGRIVNCYCPHDMILAAVYRSSHWMTDGVTGAAGVNPVMQPKSKSGKKDEASSAGSSRWIENVDIGSLVQSHVDYHRPDIVRSILVQIAVDETAALGVPNFSSDVFSSSFSSSFSLDDGDASTQTPVSPSTSASASPSTPAPSAVSLLTQSLVAPHHEAGVLEASSSPSSPSISSGGNLHDGDGVAPRDTFQPLVDPPMVPPSSSAPLPVPPSSSSSGPAASGPPSSADPATSVSPFREIGSFFKKMWPANSNK
eukprot:TRINITY_DN2688_c0_g1_i2.p1 TRINITY_DN2688_c0_g1~~TRINITY_DN2688_c0_g1_i2.p1  ORF type:complete len:1187 (-),score=289.32 TRINITY_DN2688_c0_g1_i2:99-3260(-)